MHLIIDTYGTTLTLENGNFKVFQQENTRFFSPQRISSLNLGQAVRVDTAALVFAAENQIPVLIYNKVGRVTAYSRSEHYQKRIALQRAQIYFHDKPEAFAWIKPLLKEKINGQVKVLNFLKDNVRTFKNQLLNTLAAINKEIDDIDKMKNYDQIRGWEGNISHLYWQAISSALAKKVSFSGRQQQNPSDIFNASINYGYGMLYNRVEASLLREELDPSIGFMHTTGHLKMPLVYDHIEPFRPWVDKIVVEIMLKNQILPAQLILNEENLYRLTLEARKIIIAAFNTKMIELSFLNGKRVRNGDHIHFWSAELAKTIRKSPYFKK